MDGKEFKSFYKTVGGNEGDKCKYPTRLDPYGCGCSHDCDYCYAKSLLEFRGLWHPQDPRMADMEKVRRAIARHKKNGGGIIRLGGMTDCFQASEQSRHLTYETIKELNRQGIGYLIVTKSDLIATDEYLSVLDRDLAHIQVSVTCTDNELAKTYEKAPSPTRRIRAIETLASKGYDVALRLSPFIPQYIDFDVLNSVACDKVVVEFLRVNSWVKKWFDIDYSEYTLSHAGYLHLPLETKRRYLSLVTGFASLTVCEDVTEHYEYWRDNVNPNKDDCCNLR